MSSKKGRLIYAISTLAIGAALVFISSIGAQAADAIDDPVRQPHLKSWSNVILNVTKRFVVLADFNDQAVLDRETGLVWEKSPGTTVKQWADARYVCLNSSVGGRKGWRLPHVVELASLVDASVAEPGPTLPPGHPFLAVQSAQYWSATTSAENPANAWDVDFNRGLIGVSDKVLSPRVWCVRGGITSDTY